MLVCTTVHCLLPLPQVVPFLLEDKLQELGAQLSKAEQDWGEHVVIDGNLITGQNPGKHWGPRDLPLPHNRTLTCYMHTGDSPQ
jgi:hypothetical protein